MRALVIYDLTGRIWSIFYGEEEPPQGLLCIWVDIPEGAQLDYIDLSDPENPKPVFGYLPETDLGKLQKDMTQAQKDIGQIQGNVELLKKDIQASSEKDTLYGKAMTMQAMSFTDSQALAVADLYPEWNDLSEGTPLTKQDEAVKGTEITIVRHNGVLYKVITTHNKQADWEPGQETASLFTVIDVEHAGTKEDPIPAAVNMEYFKDKYYTYKGVLYLCTRDSEIALQYTPDQLVGQYFERG